jgi:hypothetical protein
MNYPHQKWMDEFQGKVPHRRGYTHSDQKERNHYNAPMAWEHQTTGTLFSEADREQIRKWQAENDLRNQMGLENQSVMSL